MHIRARLERVVEHKGGNYFHGWYVVERPQIDKHVTPYVIRMYSCCAVAIGDNSLFFIFAGSQELSENL